MTTRGPALPGPDEWSRWRIDVVGELHDGEQSRVFEARRDGIDLAVKLTDAGLADRALLEARSDAVVRLGARHGDVVAPIAIDGASVQRIGDWFMTATPFVDGDRLDATRPSDAERLGGALARLHDALGRLPEYDIPPIRALDPTGGGIDRSGRQLLHGDFSTKNVVVSEGRLRIFDFDDCGYGPVEYDVANSLYMELFDATVTKRPERYEAFRPAFVAGYRSESDGIGDDDLDDMIQVRVGALAAWLHDLPSAPIGIRTASPAWLATLAEFVESYEIGVEPRARLGNGLRTLGRARRIDAGLPMNAGHDPDLVSGSFDIADADDQARVLRLADSLLAGGRSRDELERDARGGDPSIDLALAYKLAMSRLDVVSLDWAGRLAIVFAMWGEQRRLRPRDADNPTGEDSLHTKLNQLDWLFGDTRVDWTLVPVDDGDPDDSASIAIERAAAHPLGDRVTVLRLADVVPAETGALSTLASVDDSRKGGAIVLGALHALDHGADAIVMTDADNSVHLGQVGALLGPFVGDDAGAVIGDRKHPDAVLVKAEARWGPGIVVLRHMQRMVGRALFDQGLRDTQAAFKLYGRPALETIVAAPSTFGFAFDSDWLYATTIAGERIDRVPFAFIDSFEESASLTQGPMSTWESLLVGLVAAARARGADHDEEMAAIVDEFADEATLERVVEAVPPELESVDDADLGRRSTMTPEALREWLTPLKAT